MGQRLEYAVRNMVGIDARQLPYMQGNARIDRKGAQELLHQFRVKCADLLRGELHIRIRTATPGDIPSTQNQRFIHAQANGSVAHDTFLIAEGLCQRQTHGDADILGAVVVIHPGISLAGKLHLDARMS